MQTINLKVEDSFFPHFKAILDSFIKDKKVQVIENEEYDFENNYPQNTVISSVEEVKKRVFEAEKRISNGDFITEKEYEKQMDKFFQEELGVKR